MGSAAALGDRVIQMESMDGAARCLEALRLQHKICNCRPLEFNTRLLEVASSVGAKVCICIHERNINNNIMSSNESIVVSVVLREAKYQSAVILKIL